MHVGEHSGMHIVRLIFGLYIVRLTFGLHIGQSGSSDSRVGVGIDFAFSDEGLSGIYEILYTQDICLVRWWMAHYLD